MAGGDTLVLCYHAVSETWPADLSTTPEAIEGQLTALVERGYRGVTFSEAVEGEDGAGRRVAVTFDDAYRSVCDLALPILDRLGLPGTVFVPTAHVDSEDPMAWAGIDRWIGGPYEREMLCMSREQLRDLDRHGWEIGAHTHTHPRLSELTEAELPGELELPRRLLTEWLGKPCRSLAYPYGDFSPAVVTATRAAGYSSAATLAASLPTRDALLWPRVGVYHGEAGWRFRLKVAPLARKGGLARLRHPLASRREGR
ncbi:MAG TPA: polysaccharide deacetylase family protein [Solirubrobacterales bacterium]